MMRSSTQFARGIDATNIARVAAVAAPIRSAAITGVHFYDVLLEGSGKRDGFRSHHRSVQLVAWEKFALFCVQSNGAIPKPHSMLPFTTSRKLPKLRSHL
jgi:hypothetical protein